MKYFSPQLVVFALVVFALVRAVQGQDAVISLAGQPQVPGALNGPGTNALFNQPAGLVIAANGTVYVADSANHAIRAIATNGVVTTFAGQLGVPGSQDGPGTNAQFFAPSALALDGNGNLLVSDTGNATLRRITPVGAVTTLAGLAGQPGFADGPAASAQFGAPLGLAVATNGAIYVADGGNHLIRVLTGGSVSTFAGTPGVWGTANGLGTNAQFNAPCGLAFAPSGNLFVSDANNDTIRQITPSGQVTTYAGTPGVDGTNDGPAATAKFCRPAELAFDPAHNLIVADSFNHTLRQISPNGFVTTISGKAGNYSSAAGLNGAGRYFNPYGLAFNTNGLLLVADTYNQMIRQVLVPFQATLQLAGHPPTITLTWPAVVGQKYQVQYTTSLTGTWTNLSAVLTATAHTLSQTDLLNPAQPQRHYRVVLRP